MTTRTNGYKVIFDRFIRNLGITGRPVVDFQAVSCSILITEAAAITVNIEALLSFLAPTIGCYVFRIIHTLPNPAIARNTKPSQMSPNIAASNTAVPRKYYQADSKYCRIAIIISWVMGRLFFLADALMRSHKSIGKIKVNLCVIMFPFWKNNQSELYRTKPSTTAPLPVLPRLTVPDRANVVMHNHNVSIAQCCVLSSRSL